MRPSVTSQRAPQRRRERGVRSHARCDFDLTSQVGAAPLIFVFGGSSRPTARSRAGVEGSPCPAPILASGALKRSGLDGSLADNDRLCWVVPALLHGCAPTVLARIPAARQSRQHGRLPAVRRYWDIMIGAWIGLFKVAFFDLAGVSDAPTRFLAGRRRCASFSGAVYSVVFALLNRVN